MRPGPSTIMSLVTPNSRSASSPSLSLSPSQMAQPIDALAAGALAAGAVAAGAVAADGSVTGPAAPATAALASTAGTAPTAGAASVDGSGRLVSERAPVLVAVAITALLWGSAFVAIRSALGHFSPGALAFGRLATASVALGGLVFLKGGPLPAVRHLPRIAFCGVFWFAFYNVALNEAERRVDAGTASMLVNVGPVLIAVLAGLTLGEGFPRRLLAGCAIAFSGVAVIGFATSRHGFAPSWGAGLCLLAAVFYALGVVSQKPVLKHVPALQVTWIGCVVAAVVCSPFAPSFFRELPRASATSIGWVAYLALGPMAIGFVTWAYALARMTAGLMGSTTYLVPPVAVFLGWLLLGEVPVAASFAGGALCLCGVAVARRRK